MYSSTSTTALQKCVEKMMEICNCHCFSITKAQKAQYSSKMLESFVILIRRNRSDYCLVSIDLITGVFL